MLPGKKKIEGRPPEHGAMRPLWMESRMLDFVRVTAAHSTRKWKGWKWPDGQICRDSPAGLTFERSDR
jgi:hypothetical protein